MRSTQKKKTSDLGKIQDLIGSVAECQQQAANLKLGLIHYFLDMASTELKLLQNEDQKNLFSKTSSKEGDLRSRGASASR